ncbi:MAG: His-Xaa-Ser system radical SAM maturase HxsB [Elusimicrobiota bacterium]
MIVKNFKDICGFYFEKLEDGYFISNDFGECSIVKKNEFEKLLNKKKKKKENLKIQNELIKKYKNLTSYVFSSPSLHIMVITLRCNHLCKYCRTQNFGASSEMSEETARKTIDFILNTPSQNIAIEFQGGEPLLNWKTFKMSIDYIKSKKSDKDIKLSIVTNLSLMDDDKLKFLLLNNVSICTSLDGPEKIHNANRPYNGGSSYQKTIYWLKKIKKLVDSRSKGEKDSLPQALMTTTKFSLSNPQAIIEEYLNLGIGGIFIRPLSPIGYAKYKWSEIGYNAKDFLDFYEKSLDYIIKINYSEKFIERNAAIKLKKIIFNEDPNYLDLRSPCGGAIGQIAYNYDGDIYTCDEGRMLGAYGDFSFRIGNVFNSSYYEIINSGPARVCAMASCLENQPKCFRCAFKPYCGICPVFNYETSKTPYGSYKSQYWCEIEKGIFKILIKKLSKKENYKIFLRWFDA